MYERVLLCIPPVMGWYKGWPGNLHVGIGYLSEFLSLNGIENEVVDMRLGYSVKDLKRKIDAFNPDLIGITMVTYQHEVTYKIIEEIQSSRYKIVVGGPHVSALSKRVLMGCKADFGVKGEGEYTLLELCKGYPLQSIKGLIYRDGEEIIENENRPFIENLDDIPFPRYEKFELDLYVAKVIPILSSRGCPYNCVYCPVKVTMGRKYRARSAENVAKEIKYWYDRGSRVFHFNDDNLTFYKDRLYKLFDLIEELGLKDLSFDCGNGIRADRVDRDLLKRMKEVGFRYLAFGVESASDKVLRRIKKGADVNTMERAIKDACELGFDVGLFFMIGNPGETPADVEDSFRLALKYPVKLVFFYSTVPFPGTELYDWVLKNNYAIGDLDHLLSEFHKHDIEPLFETPEFSFEERKKALIKSQKIMNEIIEKDRKQKLEKLSKHYRIALSIYTSSRKWINYYHLWTWLLTHIHNRAIRRILLSAGRRLAGIFVL